MGNRQHTEDLARLSRRRDLSAHFPRQLDQRIDEASVGIGLGSVGKIERVLDTVRK